MRAPGSDPNLHRVPHCVCRPATVASGGVLRPFRNICRPCRARGPRVPGASFTGAPRSRDGTAGRFAISCSGGRCGRRCLAVAVERVPRSLSTDGADGSGLWWAAKSVPFGACGRWCVLCGRCRCGGRGGNLHCCRGRGRAEPVGWLAGDRTAIGCLGRPSGGLAAARVCRRVPCGRPDVELAVLQCFVAAWAKGNPAKIPEPGSGTDDTLCCEPLVRRSLRAHLPGSSRQRD